MTNFIITAIVFLIIGVLIPMMFGREYITLTSDVSGNPIAFRKSNIIGVYQGPNIQIGVIPPTTGEVVVGKGEAKGGVGGRPIMAPGKVTITMVTGTYNIKETFEEVMKKLSW